MVLQNYQKFTVLTSNIIYIVALGVGFKCPRKIHLNTQCPPPLHLVLPAPLGLPNDPPNIALVCTVLPLVHHDEHNTIGESTIQPPAQQPLLT